MPHHHQLDILFVSPDSSAKAYQELAKKYSAIETPTWSLLLAQACRSNGFEAAILDTGAERLTLEQSVRRIDEAKLRAMAEKVGFRYTARHTLNDSQYMLLMRK